MKKRSFMILIFLACIFTSNVCFSETVKIDESVDKLLGDYYSNYTITNNSDNLTIYAFAVQSPGNEISGGGVPYYWSHTVIEISSDTKIARSRHDDNYFWMDFSGYPDFTGRVFLFSVWLNNNEYALGPGETLGAFHGQWRFSFPQPSSFVYFTEPMEYGNENIAGNYNSPSGSGLTNLVPIPSALWLLGSGLIGIVGIRRKYRN